MLVAILLLAVFFVCISALTAACVLGFLGFDWALRRILPAARQSDFPVLGMFALLMMWSGIKEIRKRRWRNAFLFFSLAPIIGWAFIIPVRFSSGALGSNWVLNWWLPMILVMNIAGAATMTRLRFFSAAAFIGAVASVNSGLLGNTALSRTAANCLTLTMIAWIVVETVRGRRKVVPSDHSLPPPTPAT